MTHPAILAYEKTIFENFPLILFIGREPNNSTVSTNDIGKYNFRHYPRCGFWNIAFKLLGDYNHKSTSEMKRLFEENAASPIVFSDASPVGIINEISNKETSRKKLVQKNFEHQIDTIFYNKDFINRVKLVFFSGLENNYYDIFKSEFRNRSQSYSFKIIDIPFLFGTNFPKIVNSIDEETVNLLQSIFSDFTSYPIGTSVTPKL